MEWNLKHAGIIPVAPKAMGRPRVTKFGTYTPKTSKQYMDMAITHIRQQWQMQPIATQCKLVVSFVHPRPQRLPNEGGRVAKTTKPDIDNLLKMFMDACSYAGVWVDDNLVVEVTATDQYGASYEAPHTFYGVYTKD
jgi:Holliday junction resolvase RusA-like endonuclease